MPYVQARYWMVPIEADERKLREVVDLRWVQNVNGHILFDVEFMPPVPAERITFESFIDIELLKSLGA